MATRGAKLRYETKEDLQEAIDAYFISCEGTILRDDDGEPVLNKQGQPVMVGAKPPTITGLALALGFASRQALLNYQAKREFNDTVTRAKSRVEAYAEGRLFDRDGAMGAKFSLSNNFKGWSDGRKEEKEPDTTPLETIVRYMKREKSADEKAREIFEDTAEEN